MLMIDFFRVTPKKRLIKIKNPKGIIYSNPSGWKRWLFYLGNLLFLTAMAGFIYLYYPLIVAMGNYLAYAKSHKEITSNPPTIAPKPIPTEAGEPTPNDVNELPTPTPTPTPLPATDGEYNLEIPKIGAFAKVVTDVSPFNEGEYKKVLTENNVAQAEGTSLPGGGNGTLTYIFAHSTEQSIGMVRKNSVFYLLGELRDGDEVWIKYGGQNRKYRVYKQLIAEADEIGYLEYKEDDKEVLILQTCWPIGTAWKRLLVFAYFESSGQ